MGRCYITLLISSKSSLQHLEIKNIEVLLKSKKHFLRPKQWVGHPYFVSDVSCSKEKRTSDVPAQYDHYRTGQLVQARMLDSSSPHLKKGASGFSFITRQGGYMTYIFQTFILGTFPVRCATGEISGQGSEGGSEAVVSLW